MGFSDFCLFKIGFWLALGRSSPLDAFVYSRSCHVTYHDVLWHFLPSRNWGGCDLCVTDLGHGLPVWHPRFITFNVVEWYSVKEIFSFSLFSVFTQSQLSDHVYFVLQDYRFSFFKKYSIYQIIIIIKNYQYLLFASSSSYCTNNTLDIRNEGKKSIWPWVV